MTYQKYFLTVLLLLTVILFSSCKKDNNNNNNNKQPTQDTIVQDTLNTDEGLEVAMTIFYSLPSPTEISTLLLDNKGTFYDESLLNSLSNADKYSTDYSMALNLGIYSADLSYAGIFEQNQTVVNYMATAKKLAEKLGILNVFDEEKIKEIEENFNDRDKIMEIISNTYMESDAYLKENNRNKIAVLIMIGGWIEGMYLACSIAEKDNYENSDLVSSILEQDLSLDLLVKLFASYPKDKMLEATKQDIETLNKLYNEIGQDVSISPNGTLTTSKDNLQKIKNTFAQIRNKYIELF